MSGLPRPVCVVLAAATVVALLASGCTGDTGGRSDATPSSIARPRLGADRSVAAPTSRPEPVFEASVDRIGDSTAGRMSASWRPGCPVPLEDLRLVTLTYWSFDGQLREGELVVHAEHAGGIVSVFRDLYAARFPIQQIRLVDEFGGDDDRSMAANNTSAFNCRAAYGSQRWSEHAYGRAVDINPVQNPYVTRSGAVLPPAGAAHTSRDPTTPGLVTAEGLVVAAFAGIGWRWGGNWSAGKDYQHFSATGR